MPQTSPVLESEHLHYLSGNHRESNSHYTQWGCNSNHMHLNKHTMLSRRREGFNIQHQDKLVKRGKKHETTRGGAEPSTFITSQGLSVWFMAHISIRRLIVVNPLSINTVILLRYSMRQPEKKHQINVIKCIDFLTYLETVNCRQLWTES